MHPIFGCETFHRCHDSMIGISTSPLKFQHFATSAIVACRRLELRVNRALNIANVATSDKCFSANIINWRIHTKLISNFETIAIDSAPFGGHRSPLQCHTALNALVGSSIRGSMPRKQFAFNLISQRSSILSYTETDSALKSKNEKSSLLLVQLNEHSDDYTIHN